MAALSFLRKLDEILVVRDPVRHGPVRRAVPLGLAVRGIDVHEVHIGAEVQFPPAELAHGDDREPGGMPTSRPAS